MSNTTLPFASCLHDTLKALLASVRQGQSNVCPCYTLMPFFLDQLHHWLSLPGTQCHGSPSAVASEWTLCGDSALSTGNVEAPFALDVELPSSSGPSHMVSDPILQPLSIATLDPGNGINTSYLSELECLGGRSIDPGPFFDLSDSFHPGLNINPSMDHLPSHMWTPHALPQSPDASSSNGSLSCDDAWLNEHVHDHFVGPLPHDIQPHVQNFNNLYLSDLCGENALHSPTSSCSEERRSDCTSLMDDMDDTLSLCRWSGGSCCSFLTVDKSEMVKHLQIHHGVKPGGDKDRMTCNWDGCGKEMKKESISRHIIAIHLSNKTECGSCGKQFARFDSKLRHLKNSKREECRESESHDSRAKRRRLSWS